MKRFVVGSALLLGASEARAQDDERHAVCVPGDALGEGPIQASLQDGELGMARRACPRSEVAAGADGLAVIEPEAFYGRLRAAGKLWGSWAASEHTELFATLEAVRYDAVLSSVEADAVGLGHTSLGVDQHLAGNGDLRLALATRIVLPTATALYANAWPVGADAGLQGVCRPSARLRLHAQTSLLGSAAIGEGPAQPRIGTTLTSGLDVRALDWLSLVIDAHAGFAYAAAVDVVALGPGVRFGGGRFGGELSALVPLLGRERSLLAAVLRLGVRL